MVECEWDKAFVDGRFADPTQCGNRICDLWQKYSAITPDLIVQDSGDPGSPFAAIIMRQSDDEAAALWRKELAKHILRSINIVFYDASGEKRATRLLEHLQITFYDPETKRDRSRAVYVPVSVIARSQNLLDQLFEGIDRTIDEWRRKREGIKGYCKTEITLVEFAKRDQKVIDILKDVKDKGMAGSVQ